MSHARESTRGHRRTTQMKLSSCYMRTSRHALFLPLLLVCPLLVHAVHNSRNARVFTQLPKPGDLHSRAPSLLDLLFSGRQDVDPLEGNGQGTGTRTAARAPGSTRLGWSCAWLAPRVSGRGNKCAFTYPGSRAAAAGTASAAGAPEWASASPSPGCAPAKGGDVFGRGRVGAHTRPLLGGGSGRRSRRSRISPWPPGSWG